MSNAFDISEKTDAQIIQEANDLAREFYRQEGFAVFDEFKFYESDHPRAIKAWNMAVIAYEFLTGTDLTDVLCGSNDEPEKEIQYRAFEGADEFRPYSDWLVQPKKISIEQGNSIYSFNEIGVKMDVYGRVSYATLFQDYLFVDRKTGKTSPCGVPINA